MKLVGLGAALGEPRDQGVEGGLLVSGSNKEPVMLDRHIESWVAGFVEIEAARPDQTMATAHDPRAEEGEGNRLALDRAAK